MVKTISAGVSRANITPSVACDNMGDYMRLKPGVGIGNELYAKALVLSDDTIKIAIVTADVIGFPEPLLNDIRKRINELTGIDGKNVLLSASHTHSSPATSKKDEASKEYLMELAKKIAGAVCLADQNKQEVLLGTGIGEAKVAVNRWQKTSTGVQWGPDPNGPVDCSVNVLRVDTLDRQPLVILVNYASHPSILGADNLLYSGDYVSYVQSVIEKSYDNRVTAMFATGAGGDIKISLLTEDGSKFRYGNLEDCRRCGTIIAAEAIKVAEGIKTVEVDHLSSRMKTVQFPLKPLPKIDDVEKELIAIKKEMSELEAQGKQIDMKRLKPKLEWANFTLPSLKNGTAPVSIPVEVQMLRIGKNIVFFAVPGELFVEVGLKIKQAMALPGSFVIAYTNGHTGYMPSKQAEKNGWCENDNSYKNGGYHPSNYSGGLEDVLVLAVKELLNG